MLSTLFKPNINNQLDSAQIRLQQLYLLLDSKNKQLDAKQSEAKKLQADHNKYSNDIEKAKTIISQAKSRIQYLNNQMQSLFNEQKNLNTEINNLEKEVNSRAPSQIWGSYCFNNVKNCPNHPNTPKVENQGEIDSHYQHIQHARTELNKQTQKYSEINHKIRMLNLDLDAENIKLSNADIDLNRATQMLKTTNNELEQNSQWMAQLQKELQKVLEETAKCETEIETFQKQLTTNNPELSDEQLHEIAMRELTQEQTDNNVSSGSSIATNLGSIPQTLSNGLNTMRDETKKIGHEVGGFAASVFHAAESIYPATTLTTQLIGRRMEEICGMEPSKTGNPLVDDPSILQSGLSKRF